MPDPNNEGPALPVLAGATKHKAISVCASTGERMDKFSYETGLPHGELVIMACAAEIIAGGKILKARGE